MWSHGQNRFSFNTRGDLFPFNTFEEALMNIYKFLINITSNGEIKSQISGFTFADSIDFARELAHRYGRIDCKECDYDDIVVNDVQQVTGRYFGIKKSKYEL